MTESKKGESKGQKSDSVVCVVGDSVGFPMACQSSVKIVVLAKV